MSTTSLQPPNELELFLLDQTISGMHRIYNLLMQAAGFVIGIEALILSFGVQNRSAGAFFAGGVLLLFLYSFYYRAGQTLGALMARALAIENSLGIALDSSSVAALLTSFRGIALLNKLSELHSKKGDEAIAWISKSADYAIFGSFRHPLRSKTALAVFLGGVIQIALAIALLISNTWTI